jgi:hypothetical protein
MKHKFVSKLYRFFLVLTALAVFGMMAPQPVQAADGFFIDVVAVKADSTVTLRFKDAPANYLFTVRMDVAGNKAIDGIVVAETNSGAGGVFQETYKIPAELHGKKTIAIRVDSTRGGFYAYNWFNNRTSGETIPAVPATGTTKPVVTGRGPAVKVIGIKDNMMTVRATGFPANVTFSVRVGPFFGFAKQGEVMGSVYSGKGGDFDFNIKISSRVEAEELGAIRLDGSGYFAYNAFKYVNSGTYNPNVNVPQAPVVNTCTLVSVSPSISKSMGPRTDFDAVWEVKNNGTKNWEMHGVDYKYMSGTKMHKYYSAYDFNTTVKPGESIKIAVDMMAPSTPGVYTSNWAIVEGSTTICNLPVSIAVK